MAKNKKQKRRVKKAPVGRPVHHLPPARHVQVRDAIATAGTLISQGKSSEALDLCRQILDIEPKNAEIVLTMATAYEHLGQIPLADEAYKTAFKLVPNFVPGMVNQGLMLYRAGFLTRALAVFQSVLQLDPDFLPALDGAARTLYDLRRFQSAVPVFEKLARQRGTSVDLMELARVQELCGQIKAALATCQKTLSVTHDKAGVEILAGMFLLSHGDKSLAIERFEHALEHDPDAGFAHFHLAKSKAGDLTAVEAALERSGDKSVANVQAPLHFARGLLQEQDKEFSLSFQSLEKANRLVASVKPDDNDDRIERNLQHRSMFSAEAIAAIHNGKCDHSKRPVFVTGLPRSGTTLVEQIIAGHTAAAGLGELELLPLLAPMLNPEHPQDILTAAKAYRAAYPAELADKQRIVDKSISSALYIGGIVAMFPNARIIYCERHPMDVAWSAFKQYFNDGALAYTYSFDRIARHQRLYSENIAHWETVLPGKILRVRYEDLVTNPDDGAKRLISHINLDWQDNCLNFYESTAPVRTASYDQVRQPVYTSAINSWRSYEPWLGELKSLLKDEIARYKS